MEATRRSTALLVGLLAALIATMAGGPAGATEEGEEGPKPALEPTVSVTLDIHSDLPSSSFQPRGAIVSRVLGGQRGGDMSGDEIDADTAAEAERSLEDLGAERTPEGLVVTLPETVLFEFDSTELIGDADEVITDVAELLEFYSHVEVEVQGHTDSMGEVEYNQELSEDRAETVRSALIDAGAQGSQMTAVGFGQDRPVAPNVNPDGSDNEEGRQQNRRVEIVLRDN